MKILTCAALAAACAMAVPAFAQQPPTSSTPAAPAPTPAPSAGASASDASVRAGMSLIDSTGAAVGRITGVSADAAGAQVATVEMGAETFTVATSKLAVRGKVATINATGAELKTMIPKK